MPLPAVAALATVAFDVPVLPDADEARAEMARELAQQIYQEAKPGLGELVLQAIRDFITDLLNSFTSLDANLGLILIASLAAVVIVAAVLVIRPRLNRRTAAKEDVFAAATVMDARGHRALAEAAAARGDISTAIAEQFRAIVRAAEERTVVDPQPGRTAHEAAAQIGVSFPALAGELDSASELFNMVRYGSVPVAGSDWQWLAGLDGRLQGTTAASHPGATGQDSTLAVPR